MTVTDLDYARSLVNHPLAQRYLERSKREAQRTNHGPSLRSARDVIGEQRVTAAGALLGRVQGWPTSRRELAEHFVRAVPVLWLNEIQHVAFRHNLPRHIVGDLHLPHPLMYWTFEGSLPEIIVETGVETGWVTDAVLVESEPMATSFTLVRSHWERYNEGGFQTVRVSHGMRYPEDFTGGWGAIGQYLQAAAFLSSPYVELSRQSTHQLGTKVKWHGRRIGDPASISVVRLRASVRDAVAAEVGQGPKWQQRWLVRGHYRAQWYPSSQSHRVIWIAPYLKGPEDAPIAPSVYVVVR